jgi:hypothetical protein
MSNLETQRKLVKQLRIDVVMPRKKISETCKDLIEYCTVHQVNDALVTGFTTQKENPYKDKSGCKLV